MKRRLTLAIGCLACAMPSLPAAASPSALRSGSAPVQQLQSTPNLSLPSAAQLAQRELEARNLAGVHTIASIVFLKSAGHYDIRIEPPAHLLDGSRLRGFSIALDGTIQPATDFRAASGAPLSTQPSPVLLLERGLGTGEQAG